MSSDPSAQPGILENMLWSEDSQMVFDKVLMGDTMWAAWCDLNRDGLPDLYVGNHGGYGVDVLQRDALYIQKPDHTFFLYEMPLSNKPDRSVTGSLKDSATEYCETLAGTFADFTNDGWPDIYVTSALGEKHVLYENLGRSSPPVPPTNALPWPSGVPFVQFKAHEVGSAPPVTTMLPCPMTGSITPEAMGIAVGDFDGDGDLDLYLTDTEDPPNQDNDVYTLDDPVMLQFTHQCGPAPGGFCWGCTTHDYDNDGLLDLFAASNSGLSNFFYRNTGPPLGFIDQSGEALSASILESRGAVNLDFDLDGRMDILVINKTDPTLIPQAITPPSLYQNVTTQPGLFLKIKLIGDYQVGKLVGTETLFSTRDALNARIKVQIGGAQPRTLMREVIAYGSNAASTHTLVQHFGLGSDTGVINVTISWPSGRRQVLFPEAVNPFVHQVGQGAASVLVITEDTNL